MIRHPPRSTLFPSTTLFGSRAIARPRSWGCASRPPRRPRGACATRSAGRPSASRPTGARTRSCSPARPTRCGGGAPARGGRERTPPYSPHPLISYFALFFFLNDPAPTEIYTLPLHDALRFSSDRAPEVVGLRSAPAEETARRLRDAVGGQALRVTADGRTNALVLSGPPDEVRRARAVAARLDLALPPGSTRVNVYHLKYAAADGLVRVLAQLVGQPVGPPPEPQPHGSSLARSTARRAEALGLGYDGALGQPPPPMPISAAAEPPPAGTPSAIPLAAPVRLTADPATNTLVVSATPEDWETLRAVTEHLDVRRRQAFVEAIILEATLDKTHAPGTEFQGATPFDTHKGLAQ